METAEELVPSRHDHRGHAGEGRPQPDQGARQGRAEDHVEDGHLASSAPTRAPRRSRRSASAQEFVDEYFTGTTSLLGGVGIDVIAAENAAPAPRRLPARTARRSRTSGSQTGGEYQWRRDGPPHLFNPETVFRLQHSTREPPLRHLPRLHPARRRAGREPDDPARAVQAPQRHAPAPSRSTRSSRSRRSSSGSPPAR